MSSKLTFYYDPLFEEAKPVNDAEEGWNITLKVLSIVIILSITIMFGFLPYFW